MVDARQKLDYLAARAALLRRGSNLRRWALANNLPVGSVYNAVRGCRNGAEAHRIRNLLHKSLFSHV